MSEEPQKENEEKPQIIHIEKNTDREFSFKKMALGWIAVVGAIVILSIAVDIYIYGW